jgi:hypothetical protein
VWLLLYRSIDGCLSSYGDCVGDKGYTSVEENRTKQIMLEIKEVQLLKKIG